MFRHNAYIVFFVSFPIPHPAIILICRPIVAIVTRITDGQSSNTQISPTNGRESIIRPLITHIRCFCRLLEIKSAIVCHLGAKDLSIFIGLTRILRFWTIFWRTLISRPFPPKFIWCRTSISQDPSTRTLIRLNSSIWRTLVIGGQTCTTIVKLTRLT